MTIMEHLPVLDFGFYTTALGFQLAVSIVAPAISTFPNTIDHSADWIPLFTRTTGTSTI